MYSFNQITLRALEATAAKSAAYLDACDTGARHCRLDPDYFRQNWTSEHHLIVDALLDHMPPENWRDRAVRSG